MNETVILAAMACLTVLGVAAMACRTVLAVVELKEACRPRGLAELLFGRKEEGDGCE